MSTLSDILTSLQQGVLAINNLSQRLNTTFLQQGVVVSSASPVTALSTITFTSSQSAGFVAVTTSSGASYYLPVYR
jgi:hypothetical protein